MPKNEMKDAVQDVAEGYAECHWCVRVMKKEQMRRERDRNAVKYICPICQPR